MAADFCSWLLLNIFLFISGLGRSLFSSRFWVRDLPQHREHVLPRVLLGQGGERGRGGVQLDGVRGPDESHQSTSSWATGL